MEDEITVVMTSLIFQLGVIIFAVRIFGKLVQKLKIPSVLGELIAGIVIGPYLLGAIPLPGFPEGLFPLQTGSLAVSPELYGFAIVASIILLFASGLETDLKLFIRYSVSGGIIGLGGVLLSFIFGDVLAMVMLKTSFMDVRALFLGIMSTATSVGITARILSDKKKMDSPEGVTTLAAAVFDDVLGIVLLAVVMGIAAVVSGSTEGSIEPRGIILIAVKAFAIWLGFTALGLLLSKHIASILKIFKSSTDFSICALGLALILAGVFEKEGLAMIIGAYITGLSLSGTDIAAVIQEKVHGLYEFFVPVFFAVMGMMVNLQELLNPEVLLFGFIYTLLAVAAKVIGCAGPALGLGFNIRGALRIGCGMVPRGEVALIIAGIGITAGIINESLFGVVILMTLLTTLAAPPLLSFMLSREGRGTRRETRTSDSLSETWNFGTDEIADLVMDRLLKNLKTEGFYIQMMNLDEGISQARKEDIILSITELDHEVTIQTAAEDMDYVKGILYEVILTLNDSMQELKKNTDPTQLTDMLSSATGRYDPRLLKFLSKSTITLHLQGNTKEEIIKELTILLANSGNVQNWEQVYEDILERERVMSTGMQRGIALPHAKSDGVKSLCVAIGVKKEGVDFNSADGEKSQVFVLIVSPKKVEAPHLQVLSAVASILNKEGQLESVLEAKKTSEVLHVFRGRCAYKGAQH